MSGKSQGISETSGCSNHVYFMSDFRVPVPFQSDRVNLLANPKWQKNAKNNNLHIVWADSVLKINRKDGKVIITEGRVAMQVSFLVHSSGWHAVCGGKMKEEGLSPFASSFPSRCARYFAEAQRGLRTSQGEFHFQNIVSIGQSVKDAYIVTRHSEREVGRLNE